MGNNSAIRVMVVDDHDKVRLTLGLSLLAYDDIEVVGEATNGAEAIALVPELHPDVIIMDVHMPYMNGIEATAIIHRRYPGVAVLALTSFRDEALVEEVLQAGASDYLIKDISIDEMVAAISRAVSPPSSANGPGTAHRADNQ